MSEFWFDTSEVRAYSELFTLTTPRGLLQFNTGTGDRYYLTEIVGLDMPMVRPLSEPLPQADGSAVYDSYFGARSPSLRGTIVPADGAFSTRRSMEDSLRQHLTAISRADGTLERVAVTDAYTHRRQLTVRALEPLTVTGGILKEFWFSLIAADPRIYDATVVTTNSGAIGSGTLPYTVTNGGNTDTPPTVRIYGGITNPQATNTTAGQAVSLAYTVAAGRYVTLNMVAGSATLDDGTNLSGSLNVTSSFWMLKPGSNVVTLTGSAPNGAEHLSVIHRAAWS